MSARGTAISNWKTIAILIKKDIRAFSRDRIYSVLSAAALVMFITVFYLIPDAPQETIAVGFVNGNELQPLISAMAALDKAESNDGKDGGDDGGIDADLDEIDETLKLIEFEDEAALRRVISGEAEAWADGEGKSSVYTKSARRSGDVPDVLKQTDVSIGIVFPENLAADMFSGKQPSVQLMFNDDTPEEIRNAAVTFLREAAYMAGGSPLPVVMPQEEELIIGSGAAGEVPFRERMRPMLAFFVLMMETFALSSLIASEISQKTLTAVLVTPTKHVHVLTAKTLFGMLLASVQAAILLTATGTFFNISMGQGALIVTAILIGALMFTSIAMLIGSLGLDFISNLFLMMLCIVPLTIPAFGALFPGSTADWIRFIPSCGIMKVLIDAGSYDAGWGSAAAPLLTAAVWAAVLCTAGLAVLTKKTRRI